MTEDDTEGLGIDERDFFRDTLLHDVCSIFGTRNWILPEGVIANFENVQLHFMKVFESANRIYDRYEALLLEVCSEISRLLLEKELTSIIIYTINSLNNQTLPPLEIWKLLFRKQQTKDLQNILLIAKLCLCVPFSNAAVERFFSQMRIVKTDWRNKLNEINLSSLSYIKTQGPTLTEFHDHCCLPTVNLSLREKYPNTELFLVRIFLYSD